MRCAGTDAPWLITHRQKVRRRPWYGARTSQRDVRYQSLDAEVLEDPAVSTFRRLGSTGRPLVLSVGRPVLTEASAGRTEDLAVLSEGAASIEGGPAVLIDITDSTAAGGGAGSPQRDGHYLSLPFRDDGGKLIALFRQLHARG